MPGPPPPVTLSFTLRAVRGLPVRGASGVARCADGVLLVEDDLGIYRLRGATATLWAGPALHPALGDLEGIASSPDGRLVWALSEEAGMLVELQCSPAGAVMRRVARLPRPGRRRNKGFEGVAFAPAGVSPTRRAVLLTAHEHKPRRVSVFDLATLGLVVEYALPRDARGALDDLADLAVDPITGLLVLLSQESRRLAVLRIDGDALTLLGLYDLPLHGRERPEGLAFLAPDRLAVATEAPARLLTFAVRRLPLTRV